MAREVPQLFNFEDGEGRQHCEGTFGGKLSGSILSLVSHWLDRFEALGR